MRVFPRASTSDGLLDAMVVQRMGLMDFITKGELDSSCFCKGLLSSTPLKRSACARGLHPATSKDSAVGILT
jgi:hypothetical protein